MRLNMVLKKVLFTIAILVLGIAIGWYYKTWTTSKQGEVSLVRENSGEYNFINPLLLVAGLKENPEFAPMKKNIEAYISTATKNGNASLVSVYFQDLNSGNWTGVNQDTLYDPSSMMKVAIMLGYLKKASDNPKILEEKLKYVHTNNYGQHYPPENSLQSGTYTIKELIGAMILSSDNDALESLYNHNRESYVDIFKVLLIEPPPNIYATDFMSPKTYSRIFRTLYSSTYLSRVISDQALQLLSFTKFKNGLVAGLPKDTVVSHKFGEHTSTDGSGAIVSSELHDCGIVYFPAKPYFVCVMTKGSDFSKLEKVISDISGIVYGFVKG